MNESILEKKHNPTMENYTTPISVMVAFAIGVFNQPPNTVVGACYRILCGIAAFFIFAPFVINSLEWVSVYWTFLGFLNPKLNIGVELLTYFLTILFAEPIISIFYHVFKVILPKYLEKKFNGSTEES